MKKAILLAALTLTTLVGFSQIFVKNIKSMTSFVHNKDDGNVFSNLKKTYDTKTTQNFIENTFTLESELLDKNLYAFNGKLFKQGKTDEMEYFIIHYDSYSFGKVEIVRVFTLDGKNQYFIRFVADKDHTWGYVLEF